MMNPPSVNQIASAYQGNPAPLARKVDQDKKQHGGIPQDLRQLLALNDITKMREGAGIQQALNVPTEMPTVAQNVQQQAKQALQARTVQDVQQRMAKEGQMGIPPGTPQPVAQPQGIDTLASNVGQSYFHGGVVSFEEGGMTADQILRQQMAINEETKRTQEIERRKQEVGQQDTTQIDRLMAELENRKAKLAGPQGGYDRTMEFLEQVANAPRGIGSMAAGSYGAQQQRALQKAREEQQNVLTEKGLELAQKKADVGYQYKSDLYNTGKTAAADAIKQKYDAAIAVARSDQEKAKLLQEKELKLKELAVMKQPAVGIQVANMLMASNKDLSKEEALRQGFLIAQGGDLKTQQLDARKVAEFQDAKAKIDKEWQGKIGAIYETVPPKNEKQIEQYKRWKETKDAEIEKARKDIIKEAPAGLPQALLTPAGGAPSAPPTTGGYTVMAGGMVHSFPTQAAADAFKQKAGVK